MEHSDTRRQTSLSRLSGGKAAIPGSEIAPLSLSRLSGGKGKDDSENSPYNSLSRLSGGKDG